MIDMSRRGILAGAIGSGGLALPVSAAQAQPVPRSAPQGSGATPDFAFNLAGAPMGKAKAGCWSREANVTKFPVSTGLSGVLMSLKPGGLRELHWHANAAEWAYVISGHCRITVIDPQFRSETLTFGPGDVWYFPRGHGHSIQAIGDQDCQFILVFDSGYFSEYATFSISDWIGHTPPEVLARAFGVPAATFANFPKDEVYFVDGPAPPLQLGDPPPSSLESPSLTHRYRLLAQKPKLSSPGVSIRLASQVEFPISTTMTGGVMDIGPNAVRMLHWHPNADEWQYYLSGHARMTVFLSQGRAATVELGPGYVGYVPRGCGHYIEAVGAEPVRALVVFNSGTYEEISLSAWIEGNPPDLVALNLGQPVSVIAQMAKANRL